MAAEQKADAGRMDRGGQGGQGWTGWTGREGGRGKDACESMPTERCARLEASQDTGSRRRERSGTGAVKGEEGKLKGGSG